MNRIILKLISALILISTLNTSCKKDELRPAPSISFITEAGYTLKDTSLFAGDTVLVGLNCKWNGTDAIKTITLYLNDVMNGVPENIPSNLTSEFTYDVSLTKTELPTDKWVFEIVDSQGQKSSLTVTLNLNTAINKIWAKMGAQQNTTDLSYYSLSTKMNYNTADAKTNQTLIDMLCAYDATNALHLVSPAAPGLPEPFLTDMATWITKNNTKFCTPTTAISVQQFDNIVSEDLLKTSFSTVVANQKNKAKSLKVNDIYSFLTSSNKYGLFKVTSVTTGSAGKVSIEIKIQK